MVAGARLWSRLVAVVAVIVAVNYRGREPAYAAWLLRSVHEGMIVLMDRGLSSGPA